MTSAATKRGLGAAFQEIGKGIMNYSAITAEERRQANLERIRREERGEELAYRASRDEKEEARYSDTVARQDARDVKEDTRWETARQDNLSEREEARRERAADNARAEARSAQQIRAALEARDSDRAFEIAKGAISDASSDYEAAIKQVESLRRTRDSDSMKEMPEYDQKKLEAAIEEAEQQAEGMKLSAKKKIERVVNRLPESLRNPFMVYLDQPKAEVPKAEKKKAKPVGKPTIKWGYDGSSRKGDTASVDYRNTGVRG